MPRKRITADQQPPTPFVVHADSVFRREQLRAGGTHDRLFYSPTVLGGVTASMPVISVRQSCSVFIISRQPCDNDSG